MIGTICVAFGTSKLFGAEDNKVEEYVYMSRVNSSLTENNEEKTTTINEIESENNEEVLKSDSKKVVFDGLTLEELGNKLDRSLGSVLSNQGSFIASYSLEKEVDPYLATAIMLHETGCSYKCSSLVTYCNNVGGMKGSPSCGGGSYRSFPTLEDGIQAFIDNLANNYYAAGLTTPELMNRRYAESTTWASRVNAHISNIKSK